MRASEFIVESKLVNAKQVLQYVKKTHGADKFDIEYSITDHPQWELKNIPVLQLHLDPDGEQQDPYNRVNWVDDDTVNDLIPKIKSVLQHTPIVVDADGWIIDGNHRAMAAVQAGLTSVPALVPVTGAAQQDMAESLQVDVPNEDWLNDAIAYAKQKSPDRNGLPYMGKTTATVRKVEVPVSLLKQIPGMRNEQQNVRQGDLVAIMKIMKDTGKLPLHAHSNEEYKPFINVAYDGSAWVNEGNHRIMAAAALGWNSLPVEISYFDGGERVKSGAMYPGRIGLGGIEENFADGGNPVKFTVSSPDGYQHSFQITLAVHGKHVGHFNFVRSADTDDVNNEAEVEQRWQGQGYGKLLLMKAIDVANNHGLDFQQDIRGITDAQQNVYDSLENAGLIVTPGDGFWFLTPQGEQELNGLNENFADGKNPGRKGLSKRMGVNTKASVSSLRNTAKHSSGEKQRMAHWLANMKAGRAKAKRK